jgi:hypothetical protein
MATARENIEARILAISIELADMNSQAVGGTADTNGGGGTHVEHVEYRMSLVKEMTDLQNLLLTANKLANDAFEVTSEAYA